MDSSFRNRKGDQNYQFFFKIIEIILLSVPFNKYFSYLNNKKFKSVLSWRNRGTNLFGKKMFRIKIRKEEKVGMSWSTEQWHLGASLKENRNNQMKGSRAKLEVVGFISKYN